MKTHREFWLVKPNHLALDHFVLYEQPFCRGYETVHVIEKSAFDKAVDALKIILDVRSCDKRSEAAQLFDCRMLARDTLKELGIKFD